MRKGPRWGFVGELFPVDEGVNLDQLLKEASEKMVGYCWLLGKQCDRMAQVCDIRISGVCKRPDGLVNP